MINTPPADRLEMRWLPVTDVTGRTRMEAVWLTVSAAPALVAVHAA